jgi:hypothetical protein
VGIIPYERPHARVEVKMARPGATGFTSSSEDAVATSARTEQARPLELSAILRNQADSLRHRLDDAAELLTWRALNADADDLRRFAQLPERLWTQRHRIQNKLLSLGMNWMSRRSPSRADDDEPRSAAGR